MVEIKLAELEDAPAILALQKLAYQSEARLYNDWSIPPLTQTIESLTAEFETHLVLKAVAGDRIVGSVRTRTVDRECEIGRLIVEPERQGQGIGSALLRAGESRAKAVQKFTLFTGSKSEANIRMYKLHGYSIVRTEVLSPAVSLVFLEKPCAVLSQSLRTDA